MHLTSLEGCRLAIGLYPYFYYDARGGGGEAISSSSMKDNIVHLNFPVETFSIPPLTWKTTKFLGLPLLPGLKVKMSMDKLEGNLNKISGEILLRFEARFIFSIGSIVHFPNLIVRTSLHTGKAAGYLHEGEGMMRKSDGRTTLVGVAVIPETGNKILDFFLNLPNEALAVLKCEIK